MPKILYLVTEDTYFVSHRLDLALYAKQQGFEVAIATKCFQYHEYLLNHGFKIFNLRFFNRASCFNPIKEILALKELYSIYREFKPDIVHHVALKPIIYGTIVARIVNIPKIINAIAGLGFVFTEAENQQLKFLIKCKIFIKQKLFKLIIKNLFKIIFIFLLRKNDTLLLQNQDDLETLRKIFRINNFNFNVAIIYGSGINMESYLQVAELKKDNFADNLKENSFKININIVMLSRLLWTKGVYEFVDAARIVKDLVIKNNLSINPKFILYGDIDKHNPATISYEDLKSWQIDGFIIWKNFCQDVAAAYKDAHIVVLPSYREGLPKSLLEALACARAIVTTDVPGCREVVQHGLNGYLVPKQNSLQLAEVLFTLIQNIELIINMGNASRKIAIEKFSKEVIFPKFLNLYQLNLLNLI